jgi:hypothetical protein
MPAETWAPAPPDHPLAALDGEALAGGALRVLLGRTSRFGARYFQLILERDGRLSTLPVLSGLHHSGHLPTYNWVEVAETHRTVPLEGGGEADLGDVGIERLFALLFAFLPGGGHLMVEYDSPQRAETKRALYQNVPPIATPLGESLFRLGFGARFKDWQIAEGGSEGPRKLQAYKPPSGEHARRWRREAREQLEAFLAAPAQANEAVRASRERARRLLEALS